MRHLFIINPIANQVRGQCDEITDAIRHFFAANPQLDYDIHVTRWARDAMGFIRRYASAAQELLRVHVFGGSGTLFEAVNGVIGLPNVQLAAYPMGRSNYFLRYFGNDKLHLFTSLANQVFSGVTAIDAIRCGDNFGISHGLVGIEATAGREGVEMIEATHLPTDFCYYWCVVKNLLFSKQASQFYNITLDGRAVDGDYITMMIANIPGYGKNITPAADAHPNDERLDIYLVKQMSKPKRMATVPLYATGNYRRVPDRILHYSGKKITITSEQVMCLSVDGETFYENKVEYEVIPYAVDFVCPAGIDLDKIPRVRYRSRRRRRHDPKTE